jgi:hypothetical protein
MGTSKGQACAVFAPTASLGFSPSTLTKKARPNRPGFFALAGFLLGLRRRCRRRSRNGRSWSGPGLAHSAARCSACRVVAIAGPEEQRADNQNGGRDSCDGPCAHSSPGPCGGGAVIKIVSHRKSPIMVVPFQTITFGIVPMKSAALGLPTRGASRWYIRIRLLSR